MQKYTIQNRERISELAPARHRKSALFNPRPENRGRLFVEAQMTFEFKFEPPFLNLILRGLAELPFKESVQAIQALQREITAQEMKANGMTEVEPGADAKEKPGRPPKANGAAEQPQVQ